MNPNQPPPGYPPQQQLQQAAPQPQPAYPPQQQQVPVQQVPAQQVPVQQVPAQQVPVQQVPPQQQPQLAGPPTLHHIDHDQVMADYKDQQALMPTGVMSGWFEMPGPNGAPKWDKTVHNGFEQTAMLHICGPWAAGKKFYVPRPTHFWRSYAFPKGTSVVCGCVIGKDQCQICRRIAQLMGQADANMQKKLRDAGRVRWKFLYNVCWLENLEAHQAEDGGFSALKFEAVKGVHDKFIQIFNGAGGAMSVCDYQNGWPIQVFKKKTGAEVMNVDWDAMASMGGRQPLPQEFWGAASRLTDLEQLIALPTDQEAEMALNDMGLGGIMSGATQVPADYPGGQTPPNPHTQPQMPPVQAGFPQMQAPSGQAEYPPQFGGPSPVPTPQPPMPAGAAPQQGSPPQAPQPAMQPVSATEAPGAVPGMVTQPFPEGAPPPQQPQAQAGPPMGPPASGAPAAAGGSPQMAPPPVTSGAPPAGPPAGVAPPPVTSQPEPGYEPQPGNAGVTEGQPMPMGTSESAPAAEAPSPAQVPAAATPENFVDSPRPLQVPLPPGTQLSGGKERCFGMHNETDRSCQECPDWIKRQCIPASGQEAAPVNDPALAALQKQAAGK